MKWHFWILYRFCFVLCGNPSFLVRHISPCLVTDLLDVRYSLLQIFDVDSIITFLLSIQLTLTILLVLRMRFLADHNMQKVSVAASGDICVQLCSWFQNWDETRTSIIINLRPLKKFIWVPAEDYLFRCNFHPLNSELKIVTPQQSSMPQLRFWLRHVSSLELARKDWLLLYLC